MMNRAAGGKETGRQAMRFVTAKVIGASEAADLMMAAETLRRAREEADALVSRARDEAHALRVAAEAEGRQEGVTRYQDALFALEENKSSMRASLTTEAVLHVFAVLDQLLPHIPQGAITESLVRELLKRVRGSNAIELRVNPEQMTFCQSSLKAWTDGAAMSVTLKADASLADDECVIFGDSGSLKASLREQINALKLTIRSNVHLSEAA
jgi:type III secretion system HrpE/YscL family protein